jgi:hypothetical protein
MSKINNFFGQTLAQVREINRKYRVPQLETTLFARICLVSLRVYLFCLIGIMIFKFLTALKH